MGNTEFNLRNAVDECGTMKVAKAMHALFADLCDYNKGQIRHGKSRTMAAQTIRDYRLAWNTIFS